MLEIGPGYGRILTSFLERGLAFKEYYGVDISAQNVEFLQGRFDDPDVHFVHADIETASLPVRFDVGLSSLTFKHLFPTFEAALRACSQHMNPGGRFIFDLIEGTHTYVEHDDQTYIRQYTRDEAKAAVEQAGLQLLAFDEVLHDRAHRRLLVVAGKPD